MEDKLASMTQKMLDLQFKYLNLEEDSSNEINELNDKIIDLTNKHDGIVIFTNIFLVVIVNIYLFILNIIFRTTTSHAQ